MKEGELLESLYSGQFTLSLNSVDKTKLFVNKGQVFHCERAHLKVPGCSIVLSALLTKKLPTFLSLLNEISGGCEKILPVSRSFWSNLKSLRMILLTARL